MVLLHSTWGHYLHHLQSLDMKNRSCKAWNPSPPGNQHQPASITSVVSNLGTGCIWDMELLWLGGMLLREKVGAHTMDMTKAQWFSSRKRSCFPAFWALFALLMFCICCMLQWVRDIERFCISASVILPWLSQLIISQNCYISYGLVELLLDVKCNRFEAVQFQVELHGGEIAEFR